MVLVLAHIPIVFVTGPAEDWCATIGETQGGDIVMFEPGRYTGHCELTARWADKPGEPTVLQSFDPEDVAVFTPAEPDRPVLTIGGERLVLLQLALEGSREGVPLVEVGDIERFTARWTRMSGPGIGLQVRGEVRGLEVENATFDGLSTAIDATCASALGEPREDCTTLDLRVENSVVRSGAVGITGRARSLSILDTFVVGSTQAAVRAGPTPALEIRGSWLEGTTALVLDDATGIVTNSFLLGSPRALALTGGRASVLGATVLGTVEGAELALQTSALDRAPPAAVRVVGSPVCSDAAACWVDAPGGDFSPREGGPLDAAGVAHAELATDWCGSARSVPPTAGALEVSAPTPGVVEPGFRDLIRCEGGPPTGATPTGDTAADHGRPVAPSSGCSSGTRLGSLGPSTAILLLVAGPLVRKRRPTFGLRPAGR